MSSNPDPLRLHRKIEVRVKRPNVKLEPGRDYNDSYDLKKRNKGTH